MNISLETPEPPVLVKANHHSIELEWQHIRSLDENKPTNQRIFDESGFPRSGSLVYLQQREKRSSLWENIYIGSAMSFKVNSLKVNNQYEFRIRYKINGNGPEYSDWSSILSVSTETEPLNGDALYKAISMHGKDQLKKLLSVLGPNHRLFKQPDREGNLPLMHACSKMDIAKVHMLIEADVAVNDSTSNGKTALMVAANAGFAKGCESLFIYDADVHAIDKSNVSVLHYAIGSRNLETVGIIVKHMKKDKEFEMNRPFGIHQWTPLYRAIMLDCSKEIVEILLENGAKVNCYDKSTNTTAIQMAVIRGNIATVQLLVAYGADTKVICKTSGKSLRQLALSTERLDLVNYLESLASVSRIPY